MLNSKGEYEVKLILWFSFLQNLSHPLLAKSIQGLSICVNKFTSFGQYYLFKLESSVN